MQAWNAASEWASGCSGYMSGVEGRSAAYNSRDRERGRGRGQGKRDEGEQPVSTLLPPGRTS